MTIQPQTIYSEAIEDQLPGLLAIAGAMQVDGEGMCRAAVTLAPEEGLPLQKAMMRAEADLMLEDADRIGSAQYEGRSYEQRVHDAFMRLVQAIGANPAIP
jgi:hypothetical protein